jgi:hypothetical protein
MVGPTLLGIFAGAALGNFLLAHFLTHNYAYAIDSMTYIALGLTIFGLGYYCGSD